MVAQCTPSLLSLVRKCEQQPSHSPDLATPLAGISLIPSRSQSVEPHKPFRHRHRKHILDRAHQAKVKHDRAKMRAALMVRAYEHNKCLGYSSSMADFEGYVSYFDKLKAVVPHDPSQVASPLSVPSGLKRAFNIARASMQERKPLKFDTSALDILQRKWRDKDSLLEEDLKPKLPPLPKKLPPPDESSVSTLLEKRGTIAKYARESVDDKDIIRLRPGQWLNDEIINFYGAMLLGRSEANKENIPNGPARRGKPLNVHYFSSFFWSKLTGEGYDKGRLAKWTKKIDIFSKDMILIPVNHNNAHWTAAAINFRRKRVESYDSMGMAKSIVFSHLRKYLDAEHRNKKKTPFDFTGWQDYAPDDVTPQQENGYDCGVFTCQFLEALSRGEEMFRFTQQDMAYLRRRMIWEIGHAQLRED
ncbi:hypothetical protein Agabi119p4_909 [Agaricus bisporus var. burnettii]|uniref:Ubiquitin-like protease family profile domain-containing protein n=2 Tax=Agaricus bisporus TaxID=5341 RepID=A0A8H7FBL7_AGABI|nr:hypothetical protein Agabi119p4_909 [Agaricus bisporus var. burnettii]